MYLRSKIKAAASGRRTGTNMWRKEHVLPVSRLAKITLRSSGGEWEEDCWTRSAGRDVTALTPNTKQHNQVMLERQVLIFKLQNSLTLKTSRKPLILHHLENKGPSNPMCQAFPGHLRLPSCSLLMLCEHHKLMSFQTNMTGSASLVYS